LRELKAIVGTEVKIVSKSVDYVIAHFEGTIITAIIKKGTFCFATLYGTSSYQALSFSGEDIDEFRATLIRQNMQIITFDEDNEVWGRR